MKKCLPGPSARTIFDGESRGRRMNNIPAANLHNDDTPSYQCDVRSYLSLLSGYLAEADKKLESHALSAINHARRKAMESAISAERRILRQKNRIAYLERLAITDELTGLLNRRGFQGELARILSTARRYNENGVLIYVDMDGFKPVNDTYGHLAGDQVLKKVACILRENIRETDYAGRLGGDEFAVLLTRIKWQDGLTLAEEIDRRMNSSFTTWQGHRIALSASLGFLPYGPNDTEHDLLLKADDAMYKTKRLRADTNYQQATI